MTARIDEACGEEKTLKMELRSETMRRKMESFVVSCAGNGSFEVRRGFSLSEKTNKFIAHLDGCRQVCLIDSRVEKK